MARIMFVGDTHGDGLCWKNLMSKAETLDVTHIIQCGDFGYWEHTIEGRRFLSRMADHAEKLPIYFIDGNHENHTLLRSQYVKGPGALHEVRKNLFYIRRGGVFTIEDTVIQGIGGAFSVDLYGRTRGTSWWPEEVITDEEIDAAIEAASWFEKIDVLVTHDCPESAPVDRELAKFSLNSDLSTRARDVRLKLQRFIDNVVPGRIFHGHYHKFHVYECLSRKTDRPIPTIALASNIEGTNMYAVFDTDVS